MVYVPNLYLPAPSTPRALSSFPPSSSASSPHQSLAVLLTPYSTPPDLRRLPDRPPPPHPLLLRHRRMLPLARLNHLPALRPPSTPLSRHGTNGPQHNHSQRDKPIIVTLTHIPTLQSRSHPRTYKWTYSTTATTIPTFPPKPRRFHPLQGIPLLGDQ